MISLNIKDVRLCMSLLFGQSFFDEYALVSAKVHKDFAMTIDGKFLKNWLAEEEREQLGQAEYKMWKDVKSIIFDFIKGSRTPSLMEIQMMPKDNCYLRLQYEQDELRCITGYSAKEFTLDKTPEHLWDEELQEKVKQAGIAFIVE